jgi:four helix bundle protein
LVVNILTTKSQGGRLMVKSEIVTYMDLDVWNLAHEFVLEIYKITRNYPDVEKFGLTNQLRRAASSIPANIAEGNGKQTTRLYVQSLYISKGELNEARYFLLLSKDLNYLMKEKYIELKMKLDRIEMMLMGLIKSLKNKNV